MASHKRRPPFRSQITVVRSQVTEVEGGELGIVGNEAQDFTDALFAISSALLLKDWEVLVGLHNEEIGRNSNAERNIDSEMDRFDVFNNLALEIAKIVVSSKEKYEYAMIELQKLKDNLLSNIVADVAQVKLKDPCTAKRKGRPLEKRKQSYVKKILKNKRKKILDGTNKSQLSGICIVVE